MAKDQTGRQAWISTIKKSAGKWKKGREAQPGTGYEIPEIDNGSYRCKVTVEAFQPDKGSWKGHAVARFTATVEEGDFTGVAVNWAYDLTEHDWASEALARDLKRLLPAQEEEIANADEWELPSFFDIVNDATLSAEISIKNKEKNGKKVLQCFITKLLDDNSENENAGGKDDADSDEASDDSNEKEDGDTENESAEDDWEPQKGDIVTLRLHGRNYDCKVMTVNRANRTCNLKDGKGKGYSAISWDKLSLNY